MTLTPLSNDTAEGKAQSTDGSTGSFGQTDTMLQTPPAVDDETDQLPKDQLFGLLSNERRRLTLNYLAENNRESDLSALAEHIASIENDKPEAAITSGERKRVYVGLYQIHLPKMNEANVIEYDQARGTIELRPEADQLLFYLSDDRQNRSKSWYHHLIPAPLLDRWKNTTNETRSDSFGTRDTFDSSALLK